MEADAITKKTTIVESPLSGKKSRFETDVTTSDSNDLYRIQSDNLKDAGNKPNDHYKNSLSPFRYKLRSRCLPIVRTETEILYNLQKKLRNPVLDFYFAWTANLASHTFYVLMLPLPIWFGASFFARDLIHVLGLGIYITGFCKDYLCLPRPRSPPLHRITMSSYTAQEYGWPSSHSANATAVSLIFVWRLWQQKEEYTTQGLALLLGVLALYYVSLIFGRLYCGMHGFFDILAGSTIGIAMFLLRFYFGEMLDQWLLNSPRDDTWLGCLATVGMILGFYLALIHSHSEPVDDCPCFDDSVAFIGVLIGLDLSHWIGYRTQYLAVKNQWNDSILVNFNFEELGLVKTVLRVVLGVVLVVIWKTFSKPIIFTILPPIYKVIGIYLPRRNYTSTAFSNKTTRQIRSQSLSNMNHNSIGGEINNMIRDVIDHDKKDEVGPENDIDIYEMLDYESSQIKKEKNELNGDPELKFRNKESLESKDDTEKGSFADNESSLPTARENDAPHKVSGVFKPRFDVETIGRLVVYAGVATTASWGFALASELLHLDCNP